MKKGDMIYTRRFGFVRIARVFGSGEEAYKHGCYEPTHCDDDAYAVFGRSMGLNRMEFAAVRRNV